MTPSQLAGMAAGPSRFGNAGSPVIKKVVPLTQKSYGPMPTAVPWSDNTLDEPCQGAYASGRRTGRLTSLPATGKTLPGGADYQILADASRAAGGAYATPPILLLAVTGA